MKSPKSWQIKKGQIFVLDASCKKGLLFLESYMIILELIYNFQKIIESLLGQFSRKAPKKNRIKWLSK